MTVLVSCHKKEVTIVSPIVGHWGCNQYVSCRVDDKTFVITPSGKPYIGLKPEDIVEVAIEDLAWEGREGLRALLGFLGRFTADYGTIRLFLPRDIELLNLIRSPQAYDIQKTSHQNYMIRVVNAAKALEAMRKPAGCSFVIRVSDDLIAENNGAWKVTGDGVAPTEEEPDLSVSERALGQLVAGAVSLPEALCREDTVVYRNREMLERVFIRKPILVEDHF